ncbi:MAG: sigma factor-like helix-turn-helix DNA-binding protein [Clostridiales bacterium]|nr:sigma factor-like helix-turn-helix DNA-binding protein [Clostridiales bacterium]
MQDERIADEVSRKIELAWLMAFYGGLLTDKQRQVLTLHCEEDLSLAEIAQEAGISRQGVHDMLSRAAQRLFEMEEKLGMAARFRNMEEGLERCRTLLKEKRYDEAEGALDALIRFDQEENNGL